MAAEFDDQARSRIGTTVNKKYRLERIIGVGGMATVYEATHRNGHRVALKMLHPHLGVDSDLRGRFLREGYAANKVDHPGAVRVLDDDTSEDGLVFLVMELLEGETLEARLDRNGRQLPYREVCELAHQLLDVLAAAHAKGVVHRDLKPENLFLTRQGVLKVLDFGIARLRETNGSAMMTRTGRMIGTPAFMAPEQALGRWQQIDEQTDLYAAGATMFTLISGRFVHQAETLEEMLVNSGSRQARSIMTVAPEVPPVVAAVIDRSLAFAKEYRWPSARAMDAALDEAYRETMVARGLAPAGSSPPPGFPQPMAFAPPGGSALAQSAGWGPGTTGPGTTGPGATGPGTTGPGRGSTLPPVMTRGAATTGGTAVPQPTGGGGRVAVGIGIGVAVLAIGGTIAVFATRPKADARGTTAPTTTTSVVTSVTAPPPPTPLPPTPSVALTPSAPETVTLTPDAQPQETTPTTPGRRTGPAGPATPTGPVVNRTMPTAAPPTKGKCDPPYYIDGAGHRQYKPECL